MLFKESLPILERDDAQRAFINADRYGFNFPKKAMYVFLKESVIQSFVEKFNGTVLTVFETITKQYPIYEIQGMIVCQAPLGSAASVQLMEFLIGNGVQEILAVGSCGVLDHDLTGIQFYIVQEALRDEGTSYHYVAPSRSIVSQSGTRQHLEDILQQKQIPYSLVKTWTTDAFYRETEDMIAYRKSEGCQVVEMESAALISCAQFRHVKFGQLLFVADDLSKSEHDKRDWGVSLYDTALTIVWEAIQKMK